MSGLSATPDYRAFLTDPTNRLVKQRVSLLPWGHNIRLMKCPPWTNSKPS